MTLWTLDQLLMMPTMLKVNFDEKTITFNLPGVVISHIPFPTFKKMCQDHGTVSNILSECFIRRQVMWADYRMEKAEYCRQSLDELKDILEDKAKAFRKTGKAEDAIYADMLEAWANECVEASKSFRNAIDTERRDREAYQRWELQESSDIWRADSRIRDILYPFRLRTYWFVNAFIQLLPKDSNVRNQAQEKINSGNSLLIADRMSPDQIENAVWGIEDSLTPGA